jgi:hypothetical protein
MKLATASALVLSLLGCKREEDPPLQTTTATPTASATVASTGPTQLVALSQPADSFTSPSPTTTTLTSGQTANARAPSVVVGTVMASGMAPDNVQRVVRQNTGKYRQCYETGLRGNPALRGRVMVRMTIDASGSISSAEDAGSDMPDATVTNCVFQTLGNLTFPLPEGGSATATVPIVFSPPS